MLSHPYETLSARSLRAATIGAFAAWGVLTAVLFWAVPADYFAELRALLALSEPAQRRAMLESWPPEIIASLSFLVGFDFLYDLIHNNAAAFFVVWGAARNRTPVARSLGAATAWLMWLDTALNVFENLAFLHVLRARSPEPLLPAVSAVFAFRSATLMFSMLVGSALHAYAAYAHRIASRTRRGTHQA